MSQLLKWKTIINLIKCYYLKIKASHTSSTIAVQSTVHYFMTIHLYTGGVEWSAIEYQRYKDDSIMLKEIFKHVSRGLETFKGSES